MPIQTKKARRRKCKACKEWFHPVRPEQLVCSVDCAKLHGRVLAQKKANVALRGRREALRTRGEWLRMAQADFNRFIRLRDAHLPCVSCGTLHPQHVGRGGAWDAGHFLSRGSHPELRFEETNCHKQCKKCNQHRSGNVTKYRIELINRIGEDQVAWLEGPHEPKKYTIEEIKEIRAKYRAKCKELEQIEVNSDFF